VASDEWLVTRGEMSETQKTAVIFGLANKRSIAWAIAQKLHEAGWRLAITYQNERLEEEARDLIKDLPGAAGFMCDVTSDEQIAKLFEELKTRYGALHGVVHSVAFAPAEELKGEFVNTTREGFRIAQDISVYSLVAIARAAAPLMTSGGGIVTLTSCAIRNPSRDVFTNSPFISSAGAYATLCTSPCSIP